MPDEAEGEAEKRDAKRAFWFALGLLAVLLVFVGIQLLARNYEQALWYSWFGVLALFSALKNNWMRRNI
jgi:hypothetical protein